MSACEYAFASMRVCKYVYIHGSSPGCRCPAAQSACAGRWRLGVGEVGLVVVVVLMVVLVGLDGWSWYSQHTCRLLLCGNLVQVGLVGFQ